MNIKSLVQASALLLLATNGSAFAAVHSAHKIIHPKVLIVTMFGSEAKPWLTNEKLTRSYHLTGLSHDYPTMHCNVSRTTCMVTTAMGYANAASTMSAVALSDQLDLRKTYIIIAGIGGVDPEDGALGSAHWARYVIDGGLMHRIDMRQAPKEWTTGSFGLGASAPGEKPKWSAGTEIYHLNDALVNKAFQVSQSVTLLDNAKADADGKQFAPAMPAAQKPTVSICDTLSSDTFWVGSDIADAMEHYAETITDGKANICTTQMEDNASLTALKRGADAGKLDFNRVLVLRTGSDFDREAPGQTPAEALAANGSGYEPAEVNAYRVANKVAKHIVAHWSQWQNGVK